MYRNQHRESRKIKKQRTMFQTKEQDKLPETNLNEMEISDLPNSEVAQSYPTLCDPMDCCLPGSSVHGILQASNVKLLPSSPYSFPDPCSHKLILYVYESVLSLCCNYIHLYHFFLDSTYKVVIKDSQGVRDGHVHTAIFIMVNRQGPTVWHRGLCSVYVAGWMRGELGGEWIHAHVWLSPFHVHLKLSQHCLLISYTSI